MSWLRFLSFLSLSITVAVDILVLCHVYPAFRRTRNKAFVFLAIACALGVIDTVYDHTVSLQTLSDHDYIIARTFRRFTHFVDEILWCIGVVLLVRPYLKAPAPVVAEATQPGAAPNGGLAEPLGNSGVVGGPPSVS